MVKIKFIFNKEPVRVDFHQNARMTHIRFEKISFRDDIPTEVIPYHLRNIGSRFLLTTIAKYPENVEEAKSFERSKDYYQYQIHEILD